MLNRHILMKKSTIGASILTVAGAFGTGYFDGRANFLRHEDSDVSRLVYLEGLTRDTENPELRSSAIERIAELKDNSSVREYKQEVNRSRIAFVLTTGSFLASTYLMLRKR